MVNVSVDGGHPEGDRFACGECLFNCYFNPFRFTYGDGFLGTVPLLIIGGVAEQLFLHHVSQWDRLPGPAADLHVDVARQVYIVVTAVAPEVEFGLLGRPAIVAEDGLEGRHRRAVHIDVFLSDGRIRGVGRGVVRAYVDHMRQGGDGEDELHGATWVGRAGRGAGGELHGGGDDMSADARRGAREGDHGGVRLVDLIAGAQHGGRDVEGVCASAAPGRGYGRRHGRAFHFEVGERRGCVGCGERDAGRGGLVHRCGFQIIGDGLCLSLRGEVHHGLLRCEREDGLHDVGLNRLCAVGHGCAARLYLHAERYGRRRDARCGLDLQVELFLLVERQFAVAADGECKHRPNEVFRQGDAGRDGRRAPRYIVDSGRQGDDDGGVADVAPQRREADAERAFTLECDDTVVVERRVSRRPVYGLCPGRLTPEQ